MAKYIVNYILEGQQAEEYKAKKEKEKRDQNKGHRANYSLTTFSKGSSPVFHPRSSDYEKKNKVENYATGKVKIEDDRRRYNRIKSLSGNEQRAAEDSAARHARRHIKQTEDEINKSNRRINVD